MNAEKMTPAEKQGVLDCWVIMNKRNECALDAALFAASMTGHMLDLKVDDITFEFPAIPTTIEGYTDMADPKGQDAGVTAMLGHLKAKGHIRLGNADRLRRKFAPSSSNKPALGVAPVAPGPTKKVVDNG